MRNLALALLLGLLLGVGLAVVRELLDTSIKSPEDFEAATSAPLLGAIAYDSSARARPLITTLDSHAPRVESFRVLRTSLQFVDVDTPDKIFVVSSAVPEEGKTTMSVNLALTIAHLMRREANHAGIDMSVRELLGQLASTEETVLLFHDGGKGRPRASRMLTDMSNTQTRLAEIFNINRYAPTR